jgi:iron complex outermembrane receptor protein
VDLSGEPTGEPYLSASLAQLRLDLGGAGNLDVSGRFAYRGSRAATRLQLQGTCQVSNFGWRATQRLDMRLGWNSPTKVRPRGLVTNVLDDQYVTGVNNLTTDIFGTPFASISSRACGS